MFGHRGTRIIFGAAVLVATGAGPLAVSAAAHATTPTQAPSPPTGIRYTVRAGDSFYGVALRFSVAPAQLARANNVTLSSTLHPGQVLNLPVDLPAGLPANLPGPLMANADRLLLYPLFVAAAKEFGVPADLLMATAYVESGWKQSAVSKTGAVGVGQLKPDTSSWVAVVLLHQPALDPSKPRDNLRMSARFLRYVLDTSGGDTARALASYYQGPGSVQRDGITAAGLAYASRIIGVRPSFR